MQQRNSINLIIGVSGASGAVYAANFIQVLARLVPGKSSLIISPSALRVYRQEKNSSIKDTGAYLSEILTALPSDSHKHEFQIEDYHDIGASCASGSHISSGMVIIPCSMKTLAAASLGSSSSLIERAADVCLKERRTLIAVPRESPYSQVHLENMLRLTRAGGIILPASPGFYQRPQSIEELALFISGRVLSLFQIDHRLFKPWSGESDKSSEKSF